jgi:hypothetical protein
MKNQLIDLNNHLFAQLERLGDEDLEGEKLAQEIDRSRAITGISKEIVSNARLALDAQIALADKGVKSLPGMIENKS